MFLARVAEVAGAAITFAQHSDNINMEANANLHTFSLSPDEAQRVTVEQVFDFVRMVVDAYEKQITKLYGSTHPMVFYCWFDEQASQFRFSMVSKFYGKLPFSSPLNHVKDLSLILEKWLNSEYHSGIPFEEFKELPLEPTNSHVYEQDQVKLSLDVWSVELPRFSTPSVSIN